MIEVADAQKIILNIISNIQETEEIPIQFAVTRVLGEDIRSPNPVPAFPASIKDGYAVRASDGVGNRIVRSATAAGDAPDNRGKTTYFILSVGLKPVI